MIAEDWFGEKLEVIDSYIECEPPENACVPIWYLGESLKLLANADCFIGTVDSGNVHDYCRRYTGCFVENHVAMKYGIPWHLVYSTTLGIS